MSNTKLFSSVVLALRFPLMILVLLIHSLPTDSNGIGGDTFLYIGTLVKELFTRVAVPAFFVFSGYYALKGHNLEQWGTYKTELRKKVRTLILPYLLWNVLYLLLLVGKTQLSLALGSTPKDPFVFEWTRLHEYLWTDCLDYPLWFIRDLIVLTLISPLIHFALRISRGYIVALLFIANIVFVDLTLIPTFSSRSLLFFSFGGLFALKGWDPIERLRPWLYPSLAVWIIGTFTLPLVYSWRYFYVLELPYLTLSIVAWVLLFAFICTHYPRLTHMLQHLNQYVFFIYAVHAVLLINWARGIVDRIPFFSSSIPGLCLAYLTIAMLALAMSMVLYRVLRRCTPRLLALFCGGRV